MNLESMKKSKIKLICMTILMSCSMQVIANDQYTRPYELAHANKRLNTTYNKILSKLQQPDQLKLKKAQRAWIVFRNLDCAWAFNAEPLDCMIDRTENRAKELEKTEFFDVKSNYLSIE